MNILKELYYNFLGYLKLYIDRIPAMFMVSMFFFLGLSLLFKVHETGQKKRRGCAWFSAYMLALSLALIFVMTLYGRTMDFAKGSIVPMVFDSYKNIVSTGNIEVLLQILANILMFLPIGFCLPWNFEYFRKIRQVVWVAAIISGGAEVVQGITGMGDFEVDDILHNILGAAVGAFLYFKIRNYR